MGGREGVRGRGEGGDGWMDGKGDGREGGEGGRKGGGWVGEKEGRTGVGREGEKRKDNNRVGGDNEKNERAKERGKKLSE